MRSRSPPGAARYRCRSSDEDRARLQAAPRPPAAGRGPRRARLPRVVRGARVRLLEPDRADRDRLRRRRRRDRRRRARGRGRRAALGLWLAVLVVAVNGLVTHRGATVWVRGFDAPVLGPLDVTMEALAEGAVLALRIVVVVMAFAVYSACVDPDRVLRLLRPVAARSALTATLITRLVPVAAADHVRLKRGRRAARAGGGARGARGARAAARRGLARSLRGRGGDARAARLRPDRRRDRRAASRLTPRLALLRRGAALVALGVGARIARGGGLRALSDAGRSTRARRRSRSRPRSRCWHGLRSPASGPGRAPSGRLARLRRRGRRPVADRVLALAGVSYRYPDAAGDSLCDLGLEIGPGRARRARRPLGIGQDDAAARRLRTGAALPRRRDRRPDRGRGPRHPRPRPRRARRPRRLRRPGPRGPGRLHDGPRRACAAARAAWRRRRGARPRASRRWRSRSRSRTCSTAASTRCRAASCSASRSRLRSSAARRWSCSTSRPRSSTRSPATS